MRYSLSVMFHEPRVALLSTQHMFVYINALNITEYWPKTVKQIQSIHLKVVDYNRASSYSYKFLLYVCCISHTVSMHLHTIC